LQQGFQLALYKDVAGPATVTQVNDDIIGTTQIHVHVHIFFAQLMVSRQNKAVVARVHTTTWRRSSSPAGIQRKIMVARGAEQHYITYRHSARAKEKEHEGSALLHFAALRCHFFFFGLESTR